MRKLTLLFAALALVVCGCIDRSVPTALSNDEPSAQEKALSAKNGELVSTAGVRMIDLGPVHHTGGVGAINEPGTAVGSNLDGHACVWEKGEEVELDGGWSSASGINNRGQIVGWSATTGHGFLWTKGVAADLGTLGGGHSYAADINNRSQVVGSSGGHAFLWDDGTMSDLGAFSAKAINDRGQVVGWGSTVDGVHPFLWEEGRITDLGTLDGGWGHANGINNRGQVVGAAHTATQKIAHAFLWYRGRMSDLGTLGGKGSYAFDINNRGQIAGDSDISASSDEYHAVLWDSGRIRDLGTLPGDVNSTALSINDRGWILGQSEDPEGNMTAVIWVP